LLTVATWNVNGIRARQAQVLDWIARDRPDVVCLQEIKATPAQLAPMLYEPEGYWTYWHGEGGYSGVSLHVRQERWPERPNFEHPSFDFERRIATVTLDGITIASVYVPNGGRDYPAKLRFLDEMTAHAQGMLATGRPLVLCGDLNVARSDMDVHPKERKPVIGQRPEERERIERLLECGLTDLGRALNPEDQGMFTWWAPWRNMRQRNIGWRLDYVLASAPLAARVISCPVLRDVGTSDHAPVVATFSGE
jgi:exodeoxyribonuclease III